MRVSELATQYVSAGLSVVPIRADKSKAPSLNWKTYQEHAPTSEEIRANFHDGLGIACICGKVSGGLEVIDFDDAAAFQPWADEVEKFMGVQFFASLLIVSTPRPGYHVYLRSETVEGNQKLAMRQTGSGIKSVIETRGEGGYVLAPGCPPECHPNAGKYGVVQGAFGAIPKVSADEREQLFNLARSQNRVYRAAEQPRTAGTTNETLPGSKWAQRATWGEILGSQGYRTCGNRGDETLWTRPGKRDGVSVSTNYGGSDLLYVFSTSCAPLESERSYSKFAAYTFFNHGGDFHLAARQLVSDGHGAGDPVMQVPAIVQSVSEMTERVLALYESGLQPGENPGWLSLAEYWTVRKGEWTLITGIPSHGKTGFADAVMVNIAKSKGWRWAIWSAENRPEEIHVASLLEQYLGKPFNRGYRPRMTEPELRSALKWIESQFVFLKCEEEHETIAALVDAIGKHADKIDGFIIDPWNELTHAYGGKTESEHVSRQLKIVGRFCKLEQKHGLLVAHPAKMKKEQVKGGGMAYPVPGPYDVSGSAHFRNKADNCLCVWRDESTPGTTVVYVQKIRRRFVGKIGSVELGYDVVTGKYSDLVRQPGEDDE